MLNLQSANDLCRMLADPSRLRLLAILAEEPMTVAELCEVTRLTQSRVSTHLAKLKEVDLVQVRRTQNASFYAADESAMGDEAKNLWSMLQKLMRDPLLESDLVRARAITQARNLRKQGNEASWADNVAGQMERFYSPGRTWEATARALIGLSESFGDVLDIASGDGVIAGLLATKCRRLTCLDVSEKVIEAARQRLRHLPQVDLVAGDMHALPFEAERFDHVLLLNALSYANDVPLVFREAGRVLRKGGNLVGVTLEAHAHEAAVKEYGHANLGFRTSALKRNLTQAGLAVALCEVTHEETRPPYFRIITFHAKRPAKGIPRRVGKERERKRELDQL